MVRVSGDVVVSHYHRADRRPFQNLSDLRPGAETAEVLAGLESGSRRRFGPRYLALRRDTEARARDLFVAAGGRPVRHHPHYFVLGQSPWFAGLYDDPRRVELPLARLPAEVTSFTWTDSIAALGLGERYGVPSPEPALRGLHPLAALDLDRAAALTAAAAAGPHDYEGHQWRLVDHYVEIQLWSDEPVAQHLTG